MDKESLPGFRRDETEVLDLVEPQHRADLAAFSLGIV
jgi:hypothetical protein